jgi:hypothetical protein
MILTFFLGACDDPVQALQASSMAMTVLFVQATNELLLQNLVGSAFTTVDSASGEDTLQGGADPPSPTWRVRTEQSTLTGVIATGGFKVSLTGLEF